MTIIQKLLSKFKSFIFDTKEDRKRVVIEFLPEGSEARPVSNVPMEPISFDSPTQSRTSANNGYVDISNYQNIDEMSAEEIAKMEYDILHGNPEGEYGFEIK